MLPQLNLTNFTFTKGGYRLSNSKYAVVTDDKYFVVITNYVGDISALYQIDTEGALKDVTELYKPSTEFRIDIDEDYPHLYKEMMNNSLSDYSDYNLSVYSFYKQTEEGFNDLDSVVEWLEDKHDLSVTHETNYSKFSISFGETSSDPLSSQRTTKTVACSHKKGELYADEYCFREILKSADNYYKSKNNDA
jgi:hypothetical protein